MPQASNVAPDALRKRQSKLFYFSAIENKVDEDERMESCYKFVISKIKDLSDKETHDALVAMASQNSGDDVSLGLLYGILTNVPVAAKYYRDLTMVTRDSFKLILSTVNWIIIEMYNKLLDTPKTQLLWFLREAVKNNVNHIEIVCMHLMRVVSAGNLSSQNLWLIDTLLSIFNENKAWLDRNVLTIGYCVYFFLRLIPDHISAQHENLRNKEVKFCITHLRERFMDCLNVVQRELGRALMLVSKIPEFEKLWADILHNPTVLSPSFTGVWQLLSFSNPKRNVMNKIILCRLTIEVERKVFFFLHNVSTNNQKQYLEWFHRQYLVPLDSQTIRSDLIRYVCCMVHPPNSVLASDVVPRWMFVTWLLTTCQNPVEVQLMRLSLFYDWLFFDPDKESIMNIEPAILVLYNTLKTQPLLASSLMDFLCRLVYNFCPTIGPQIKNCVSVSLRQLQDKKVLQSLTPLFDSPKFDAELRLLIREVFDEFCPNKEEKKDDNQAAQSAAITGGKVDDLAAEETAASSSVVDNTLDVEEVTGDKLDDEKSSEGEVDAESSRSSDGDEDEDTSGDKEGKPTKNWSPESDLINPLDDPDPMPVTETLLLQLDDSLRPLVESLQKSSEDDVQGDTVYKILQQILTLDTFDEDQASALAECLCGLFKPFFARRVFPKKYESDADVDETLQAPIFVIFRNLCFTPDQEMASRRPQLFLISEMYIKQPRVGYLLLYFLVSSNNTGNDRTSAYRGICSAMDNELSDMLLKDLTLCQQDDYRLFVYLVTHIYKLFPQFALQSADFMHLIVSTIDAIQLQDLICEVVQGNLTMFRKDYFSTLLNASLSWETIEQYFFWQLVSADDVPLDWALPVIPKLVFPPHAEAMANILLMLKRLDKDPTMLLVRQLLSREPYKKGDLFCVSALKILIDDYEDKMIDLISSLLQKTSNESNAQSKLKKPAKTLTMDYILGHLDMFRQYNKQGHTFFSKEAVQQALQDVRKSSPDALKAKYSELFAMMEILDSLRESKNLRRGRKSAATQHHDSSDDEKERHLRTSPVKPVKKKRKVVESDSE